MGELEPPQRADVGAGVSSREGTIEGTAICVGTNASWKERRGEGHIKFHVLLPDVLIFSVF